MKHVVPPILFSCLCILMLFSAKFQAANAQSSSCQFSSIDVQVFPMDDGVLTLQRTLTSSVTEFLTQINARSIDTLLDGVEISEADRASLNQACTLHQRYKILVVPVIREDGQVIYEIRGLHLSGIDREHPQLALTYNGQAELLRARIFDVEDRRNTWSDIRDELGNLPRGVEVLDMIKELEEAYNTDAIGVAEGRREMPNLSRLLRNAEINVSTLRSGQPRRVPYRSSAEYIRRLANLIRQVGAAPKITYELVTVYPHRDELGVLSNSIYRVALIQHWMFPPGGYLDTDYVSLDIELANSSFIRSRNAGRGSFVITSNPSGVQISEFNRLNWEELDIKTPFTDIVNAPWQFHYVTLKNIWYETEFRSITPDQVLTRSELHVDMSHKPGQIQLTVLPDEVDAVLNIQEGEGSFQQRSYTNGSIVEIPVSFLKDVPDSASTIRSDTRRVRLQLTRAFYEPVDTTITLPGPDPFPVTIEMKRQTGILQVTSSPTQSSVAIDADSIGLTPLEQVVDVTGNDGPLQLSVSNDQCMSNGMASDCVLHVPSPSRAVEINAGVATAEHFDLQPFIVRNLTETASWNVLLQREGERLMVDYLIDDNKGRDRKYIIELAFQDSSTWEPISDVVFDDPVCTSENACFGNKVRPGAYSFNWNMDSWTLQSTQHAVPVLTLRRKGLCWPCVLIPAAAGGSLSVCLAANR